MIRLKHSIGANTSGDPAIFVLIVLDDSAMDEQTFADMTNKIATTLFNTIRPYENWGSPDTSPPAVARNKTRMENGPERQWLITMI